MDMETAQFVVGPIVQALEEITGVMRDLVALAQSSGRGGLGAEQVVAHGEILAVLMDQVSKIEGEHVRMANLLAETAERLETLEHLRPRIESADVSCHRLTGRVAALEKERVQAPEAAMDTLRGQMAEMVSIQAEMVESMDEMVESMDEMVASMEATNRTVQRLLLAAGQRALG